MSSPLERALAQAEKILAANADLERITWEALMEQNLRRIAAVHAAARKAV